MLFLLLLFVFSSRSHCLFLPLRRQGLRRVRKANLSLSLSLSLALSPIWLEGSLVSALNATYRLECEARAPWFIGKGEWIFIRNYEIVVSLVFSFLRVYNRSCCVLSCHSNQSLLTRHDVRFSIFSVSQFLMRWGHFFHTLRNMLWVGTWIRFIAETVVMKILLAFLFFYCH